MQIIASCYSTTLHLVGSYFKGILQHLAAAAMFTLYSIVLICKRITILRQPAFDLSNPPYIFPEMILLRHYAGFPAHDCFY